MIGAIILLIAAAVFAATVVRWSAGKVNGGVGPYFWIFSGIGLVSAIRVITHPQPVYSALYFVLSVFATAGLFLLMQAEFMAMALILIYAGAILVTYVFVIMLAAEATPGGAGTKKFLSEHDAVAREPVVATLVGFAMMALILYVVFDKYQPLGTPDANAVVAAGITPVQQLGTFLFQTQLVNLQLAGYLLTVAMIGAIMIARRQVYMPRDESAGSEVVHLPNTPVDDDPHSIPVFGTADPRQKEYPEM